MITKAFLRLSLAATILFSIPMQAATIVGLTTANQLVTFQSSSPNTTSSPLAVTGLLSGHQLTGIDFRPIDGALVGVSRDSSGNAQTYVINQTTGVATALGNLFSVLPGTTFGIDFNPVANALRIVTDGEANLRLPMGGAGALATDTSVTRSSGNADPNLRVVSAAYSNNVPGGAAGATTLYDIDAFTGSLYSQGLVNFAAPTPAAQGPNGGQLTLIGSLGLGVNLTDNIGFDINGDGSAFVSYSSSGSSQLYTINLATGATTLVGSIGNTTALRDITSSPVPEPSTVLLSALGLLGLGYFRRR